MLTSLALALREPPEWMVAVAVAVLLLPGLAAARTAPSDLEEARSLYDQGRDVAAIERLEELLEREPPRPDRVEALVLLAMAWERRTDEVSLLKKLGTSRRQRRALERALTLDPDHVEARKHLADFFHYAPGIAGGSESKAAEQRRLLLAVDAGEGHALEARHALDEQELERSIAEYRRAVAAPTAATASTRARWWYWLGVTLRLAGRPEEAFEPLESSLALDPARLDACYQIGRAAELSGLRLEQGIECLRRFLRGDPGSTVLPFARAHLTLGKLYLERGEPAAARRHFEQSLRLEPDDAEARRLFDQTQSTGRDR